MWSCLCEIGHSSHLSLDDTKISLFDWNLFKWKEVWNACFIEPIYTRVLELNFSKIVFLVGLGYSLGMPNTCEEFTCLEFGYTWNEKFVSGFELVYREVEQTITSWTLIYTRRIWYSCLAWPQYWGFFETGCLLIIKTNLMRKFCFASITDILVDVNFTLIKWIAM